MINIAMNSKSAMNYESLLSINRVTGVPATANTIMQQAPAAYTSPVAQQATVTQSAPTMQQAPVTQSAPTMQQTPVMQSTPVMQQTPVMQSTPAICAGAVSSYPTPTLYYQVQKGQKVQLSTSPVDYVQVRLGWNTYDARCDVDVSAFMLGSSGKVIGDDWFVFYGQTLSPDKSLEFFSTDSTDREKITVDFTRLDSNVQKIVFVLTINDALTNNLNFSMLSDAYIRITDYEGNELVSFMMTDYYSNVTSMMIGELYIHNGIWKFNAIGNGVAKDLAGLCELYGVQTTD